MYKLNIINNRPEQKLFGLSVSKRRTYFDCKAKYKFCYILKFPRVEQDFQIFGKFLHRILEEFHKQRLEGNTDPDNVLMTASFKIAEEEYKDKVTAEQLKESKEICISYLKKLQLERDTNQVPLILSVEKEFSVPIDNQILLNGFIDRVQIDPDGVMKVSDYKSSDLFDKDDAERKSYLKSKKYKRYCKDTFQLETYAYVMFLSNPELQTVRCSYVFVRHDFSEITIEMSREQAMKIKDVYLENFQDINNEKLFRPKVTPLCNWCDYKEKCPEGREYLGLNMTKFGETEW